MCNIFIINSIEKFVNLQSFLIIKTVDFLNSYRILHCLKLLL